MLARACACMRTCVRGMGISGEVLPIAAAVPALYARLGALLPYLREYVCHAYSCHTGLCARSARACLRECMCAHMHVRTRAEACVYTCTPMHTCVCLHMRACMHTHAYAPPTQACARARSRIRVCLHASHGVLDLPPCARPVFTIIDDRHVTVRLCTCMHACVRPCSTCKSARAHAYVCTCLRVYTCVGVCMCASACVRLCD